MQSIQLVTRTTTTGFLPCVVYGKNSDKKEMPNAHYYSESFSISLEQLKILKSSKLKARALPLEVTFESQKGQEKRLVIIKDIQFHPISGQMRHIDFFLVDNLTSFETLLPIRVIGKENSIAIKEGAVINQVFKQIKAIRTHSSNTEEIVLDISNLKKKDIIKANDIELKDVVIKNNPVLLTII